MTPNPELPTAQRALALAFEIVRTPCSAAETQRAEVLLGIAREIREEQQYRATRKTLAAFAGRPDHAHYEPAPADTAKLEAFAERFRNGGEQLAESPREGYDPDATMTKLATETGARPVQGGPYLGFLRPTPSGEPISQAVGRGLRLDAARTLADIGLENTAVTVAVDPAMTQRLPIVWSVGDKAQCRHCHTPIELCPVAIEQEGEPPAVWRHKYTQQATCLAATMSSDAADVAHTFAEPEPRK